MENKRLFVGNINAETKENDLKKAFGRYGTIQSIELKTKANLVDPDNPIHFAFISILTDDFTINRCLNRFSEKDFNGQFLRVSIAKESFLDRLKKERENSENVKNSKTNNSEVNTFKFNENNSLRNRKTFDSDDELFDENTKNESITNKTECSEENEGKLLNDNEKRIQSLKKMQEIYTQKKLLIQQSLSKVANSESKKIKFDFYESDEEEKPKKRKVELFQNSDNEESDDQANIKASIQYRQQFDSEEGQKLLKMQSKFNGDSRFKMTKKFLNDLNEKNKISDKNIEELEGDENINEKDSQIRIIEEIVGRKLTKLKDPNHKMLPKAMIRFDPKNEDHQQLVNSMKNNSKTVKNNGINLTKETKLENMPNTKQKEVEVSKDQFYTINENLQNSLKRRGDGFSLLSMFGRDDKNESEIEKHEILKEEKIFIKATKGQILAVHENPFKFDSSDSEDNNDMENKVADKRISKVQNKEKNGKLSKSGAWLENFSIFTGDKRLEEGAKFYKSNKNKGDENIDDKEDYGKVMEKLRLIINKKISKSKKSVETKNKFRKKGKSKR